MMSLISPPGLYPRRWATSSAREDTASLRSREGWGTNFSPTASVIHHPLRPLFGCSDSLGKGLSSLERKYGLFAAYLWKPCPIPTISSMRLMEGLPLDAAPVLRKQVGGCRGDSDV